MEVAMTLALITFGAAVFALAVKTLPVFPKHADKKAGG
jgi:hypothetical protein